MQARCNVQRARTGPFAGTNSTPSPAKEESNNSRKTEYAEQLTSISPLPWGFAGSLVRTLNGDPGGRPGLIFAVPPNMTRPMVYGCQHVLVDELSLDALSL